MKGVVFTEFLDFADSQFGMAIVEESVAASDLPSSGAYTTVGTYDHTELITILKQICSRTGKSASEVLIDFGSHLFGSLVKGDPSLLNGSTDSFSLLERVEGVIHVEVRKLYPDAQLPTFRHERLSSNELHLEYQSSRALGDLAEGLLRGCFIHFGDTVDIQRQPISADGQRVRFHLKRK